MAVFRPYTVNCVCGAPLSVHLADSINVKRSPSIRDRILRGELHRATCAACGRTATVEKPFYYTDLVRNVFFKVLPRGERHRWKIASQELETASKLVPDHVAKVEGRTLRVIFGMDDLREKLLAQDAELDDRLVELLKVPLVHEHPFLLRRSRLRLVLDKVTEEALEFTAAYEHDPRQYRLVAPLPLVQDFFSSDPERTRAWVMKSHPSGGILKTPDHWVNMWRWSPQPSALEALRQCASDIREGKVVDTGTPAFRQMVAGLPSGSHLPSWAKKDLQTLFDYAKANDMQELQDQLFEKRFGIELEDDWSLNDDPADIETLWKLLRDLPENNIVGNTKIHEILLDKGKGGGVYSPTTHDISIGSLQLPDQEGFEDVVRHEVGHAVHEMKGALVDDWLGARFGWETFDVGKDAEVDRWVELMGGWGETTAQQKREVRQALRMAAGSGSSWLPGPTPALPPSHPWRRADFGPRLAFEKTGPNWYGNYPTWYRAKEKAFFLNFWYRTLVAVDAATLDLVAHMPSSYAAMSHFEFFAELYALYYDKDDPKRPSIPADVTDWLDQNISVQPPASPAMPAPPVPKAEWETTDRPGPDSPPSRK